MDDERDFQALQEIFDRGGFTYETERLADGSRVIWLGSQTKFVFRPDNGRLSEVGHST